MRITFLTSKLNFTTSGGSVEEYDLLARTLQRLGNEVTVVTAYSHLNNIPEPLPYRVIEERAEITDLFSISRYAYVLLKKYSKQTDFFHVDGHQFLYGAGAYRMLGGHVPIVALFNNFMTCWTDTAPTIFPLPKETLWKKTRWTFRYYTEKYLGMFIANHLDLLTFVSPNVASLYQRFGLRKDRSFVLGDLIDYEKIMREGGIDKESYIRRNKRDGIINLFFSSRMVQGKGFDLLIDGFSKVQDKKRFHLTLGGSGPLEDRLKRLVTERSLNEYIAFTGWISKERLYELYKTADIFIQVGWRPEGTSISLLYAMAFGVPSILPTGSGMQWAANDSAIYVENGDPNDLARAIEQLGDDANLRAALSHNCYKRIADDEMDYLVQIRKLHGTLTKIHQQTVQNV